MENKPNLNVGEAVFYAREHALGIVYTTYERCPQKRSGVQVLLANGRDLSGFCAEEADQLLTPLGDTGLAYDFQNVGQLAKDYGRGVFGEAFRHAQVLHIAQTLAGIPPPAK